MITAYVVLDGFDLGAGVLHLFIARTDQERRTVIRTIGPVWDGNEVWLLAGGGTLYFAFPLLYASGFSGFYLPLMIVLWLLILRGLGIELRMHLEGTVWRGFFDGCFALSSILLTIFYGAALGNVIRGVPLQQRRLFFPASLDQLASRPRPRNPGLVHRHRWRRRVGCSNHSRRELRRGKNLRRSQSARPPRCCHALAGAGTGDLAQLWATLAIRPDATHKLSQISQYCFSFPVAVALSLIAMFLHRRRNHDKGAFLASCAYLIFMLVGAAAAVYPNLLVSTTDPALNITVYNAAAGSYSLSYGLIWWSFGMPLALGYFVFIYRMFRGKVTA